MGLVKEFREFALKGSVIDLAAGVVIGASFQKVVSSLVDDIMMPPLGRLVGKHDFSNYFLTLSPGHFDSLVQAKAAGAATLNYGLFANALVTFLIIGLAIFVVIRQVNRMTRNAVEQTTSDMRDCPHCLSAIPAKAQRCRYCTSPAQ